MGQNKLKKYGDETEFMASALAFVQKVIAEVRLGLPVGDAIVSPANRVRNLGVISDCEMSMRQQVNGVTSSAYYHMRAFSRIRRNLDSDTFAAMVEASILSRLDHADTLLYGLQGQHFAEASGWYRIMRKAGKWCLPVRTYHTSAPPVALVAGMPGE